MRLLIPPPVMGLLTGVGMWLLHTELPQLSFDFAGKLYVAIAIGIIGLGIEFTAFAGFQRVETTVNPMRPQNTSALVERGLYRFSRNPMYVGLLCMVMGWAIWLGAPLNIVLLALLAAYLTVFQIKPEEAVLREKFGASYEAYCRRVRRWL